MTEDRIRRSLRNVMEPAEPDPAFAERLYDILREELRPDGRLAARRTSAPSYRTRARHPRRLLLVAILALGGGAALLAGGGAWRATFDAPGHLEPPDVCALITPDEISAIQGGAVRLVQPLTRTESSDQVTLWCGYSYLAAAPAGPETREVHLRITAYADAAAAAAFLQQASETYGAIQGLGDGATVLMPTAASASLVVLVGNRILQVTGDRSGTYIDLPRARAIAERILERL